MKQPHAVIIGAGFGGLAAANLLAKAGYKVSVYEKQSGPGGRAGLLKINGFTFDTGPSWYLMPEVFEHYFATLGERVEDHLILQRLDPAYKVIYADGSSLDIHANLATDKKTFDHLEPGAGTALERYLAESERTYTLATKHFLYTNFSHPTKLLHPEILSNIPSLIGGLATSLQSYVERYIHNPKLQKVLQHPMVFLGTAPSQAPSMYRLMSHMDFTQGVFYPQGGIYTLVEALVSIGKKLGVTYHYNAPATRILHTNGKASGIELADGTTVKADLVVSDADLHYTETQLLPHELQTYSEEYWQRKEPGPSAILMYLGVRGKLPQLAHHTLYFVDEWDQNFRDIYRDKAWPKQASMYVCKPSQTDPTVAPKGHENVFVLVPGPANNAAGNTQELAAYYLDKLIAATGIHDLRERLVVQRFYGPSDFAQDYNSWHGTALGLSHVLRQSAFFRPKNYSRKLKNLYYVGANTVPGIGLPMCLISAEVLYKTLTGDTSSAPISGEIKEQTWN